MYEVQFKNDRGDWIHFSSHRNLENAEINAEVKAKSYTARIIKDGKIIHYFEREAK